MDKLIDLAEGKYSKRFSAKQNLMFVMGAVRGIKNNAEKRLDEFEKEYAPKENA